MRPGQLLYLFQAPTGATYPIRSNGGHPDLTDDPVRMQGPDTVGRVVDVDLDDPLPGAAVLLESDGSVTIDAAEPGRQQAAARIRALSPIFQVVALAVLVHVVSRRVPDLSAQEAEALDLLLTQLPGVPTLRGLLSNPQELRDLGKLKALLEGVGA